MSHLSNKIVFFCKLCSVYQGSRSLDLYIGNCALSASVSLCACCQGCTSLLHSPSASESPAAATGLTGPAAWQKCSFSPLTAMLALGVNLWGFMLAEFSLKLELNFIEAELWSKLGRNIYCSFPFQSASSPERLAFSIDRGLTVTTRSLPHPVSSQWPFWRGVAGEGLV